MQSNYFTKLRVKEYQAEHLKEFLKDKEEQILHDDDFWKRASRKEGS